MVPSIRLLCPGPGWAEGGRERGGSAAPSKGPANNRPSANCLQRTPRVASVGLALMHDGGFRPHMSHPAGAESQHARHSPRGAVRHSQCTCSSIALQ